MSNSKNILPNPTIQVMKQQGKAQPFGAHFATKLEGVNSKLICALSYLITCSDDPNPKNPREVLP